VGRGESSQKKARISQGEELHCLNHQITFQRLALFEDIFKGKKLAIYWQLQQQKRNLA